MLESVRVAGAITENCETREKGGGSEVSRSGDRHAARWCGEWAARFELARTGREWRSACPAEAIDALSERGFCERGEREAGRPIDGVAELFDEVSGEVQGVALLPAGAGCEGECVLVVEVRAVCRGAVGP